MTRWLELSVGALLATGTMLAFRQPLLGMVARWDGSPMYSYGYCVPLISAYLMVSRKEHFAAHRVEPARVGGGAVIAASLLALTVARMNAIQVIEQLAFVSAIAGIVLFLFGWSYFKLSAPAIAYLLFMIPMWDGLTEPLHWPFQLNSAKLGVSLMHAINVPAYRENTVIALPNLVIEVARECSGVNYLVAVIALALPLSFLRLRQAWRRLVLIGAALTIAALANSLRVALIGTLAYYEIGSPLHGPFHVLHGLFVSAIGFVVIFVGIRVLEQPDVMAFTPASAEPRPIAAGWRVGDAIGLATVFWTLALVGVAPQAQEVALARPLETLPLQLGVWSADAGVVGALRPTAPEVTAAWSGADGKLERVYRSASGRLAKIEVFYFAVQRQGREIVSSAAGELHRSSMPIEIPGDGRGRAFVVNAIDWPDRNETGLFWYDSDGRIDAGQVATKLSTMWRALSRGRTNGAAVVLRTASDHPGARAELEDLAKALQPALSYLWTAAGSD